jgi:hypothetical protein
MMSWYRRPSVSLKRLFICLAILVFFTAPGLAADEGTFTGTWIASGTRQIQDFAQGREVFTFHVKGHVNLQDNLGEVADFWSECAGLWDAEIGSTTRCVWRGLEGQKVFIALDGQPLEEGVKVTGEIVGGTGRLEGITGRFTFTWTSVFINEDTDTLTGHTENISGSYRIP